jgi:hypothetical protein
VLVHADLRCCSNARDLRGWGERFDDERFRVGPNVGVNASLCLNGEREQTASVACRDRA